MNAVKLRMAELYCRGWLGSRTLESGSLPSLQNAYARTWLFDHRPECSAGLKIVTRMCRHVFSVAGDNRTAFRPAIPIGRGKRRSLQGWDRDLSGLMSKNACSGSTFRVTSRELCGRAAWARDERRSRQATPCAEAK